MRVCVLTLILFAVLLADDPPQLAVALKAQSTFDKVEMAPLPSLADTGACVQSQAALISVSLPEEMALVHFRKGFCTLAGAAITGANREFLSAAADFDRAIEVWPARMRKNAKNPAPDPVSSGLRVAAWVARLLAWTDDSVRSAARREISAALVTTSCTSNLMPAAECERWLDTGRQWLGWMALRENRVDEAAKYFAGARETGWPEWVAGRQQLAAGKYGEAVAQYVQAIRTWKAVWRDPGTALVRRLGPAPDLPMALGDLGGAQLLAGDTKAAIASLDESIKLDPASAQSFYRRARAREVAGQVDLAIADYNLASRTAFASSKDLVSGEAHLYRGILLYRRKEFGRAEDEFASALNFEIPDTLRADARAWRHLAAVASGACATAREFLDRTLVGVSPYFPKNEAREVALRCTRSAAVGAALVRER